MHSVYFIPGMFGFGELAGYDYFHHLREGLDVRYRMAGVPVRFADVPTPPTSSIRERAVILSNTVRTTDDGVGPIHLVGHSTGGIDGRLVLSPTVDLGLAPEQMAWTERVATLVTVSTPHHGTPLASHFTTLSGARLLYAGSLLTVISLRLGEPWLALLSRLLSRIQNPKRALFEERDAVIGLTNAILRFVDDEARRDILQFLRKIKVDQGAIVQISPEAMDLLNTSLKKAKHVRYGCVIAGAPPPRTLRALRRVRTPYTALTAVLYAVMYAMTARKHARYDYPKPDAEAERVIRKGVGRHLSSEDNDGVVPTRSMIWGDVLWAGEGDHLDVIGHFRDDHVLGEHVDWLNSGSCFSRSKFHAVLDALADYQLGRAAQRPFAPLRAVP